MLVVIKSTWGLFFSSDPIFHVSTVSFPCVLTLTRAGPGTAELRQILCQWSPGPSGRGWASLPGATHPPVAMAIMGPDQINKHNNIIINAFTPLRWTITIKTSKLKIYGQCNFSIFHNLDVKLFPLSISPIGLAHKT